MVETAYLSPRQERVILYRRIRYLSGVLQPLFKAPKDEDGHKYLPFEGDAGIKNLRTKAREEIANSRSNQRSYRKMHKGEYRRNAEFSITGTVRSAIRARVKGSDINVDVYIGKTHGKHNYAGKKHFSIYVGFMWGKTVGQLYRQNCVSEKATYLILSAKEVAVNAQKVRLYRCEIFGLNTGKTSDAYIGQSKLGTQKCTAPYTSAATAVEEAKKLAGKEVSKIIHATEQDNSSIINNATQECSA